MLVEHQPLDQMLRVVLDGVRKDVRDRVIDIFPLDTFLKCFGEEGI